MPSLLVIEVSPRFDTSVSRKLTALFTDQWRARNADGRVVIRDLARNQPPYVDLPWIGGAFAQPGHRTVESSAAIAVSDELVGELQAADEIVIGTPMYNFSIPAVLKGWIDHVVRIGVTVKDNVGQLTGKRATVILASGGDFSPGSPIENYNQASGYLRTVLGFVGIVDVQIILADGARAGQDGETAVTVFGDAVRAAA